MTGAAAGTGDWRGSLAITHTQDITRTIISWKTDSGGHRPKFVAGPESGPGPSPSLSRVPAHATAPTSEPSLRAARRPDPHTSESGTRLRSRHALAGEIERAGHAGHRDVTQVTSATAVAVAASVTAVTAVVFSAHIRRVTGPCDARSWSRRSHVTVTTRIFYRCRHATSRRRRAADASHGRPAVNDMDVILDVIVDVIVDVICT